MDEKFIEYLVGGKRFTDLGGYLFDKLIFGIYILIVLLLFVCVFIASGSYRSNHIHYVCDSKSIGLSYCEQPFFMNYPLCEKMWLGACDQKFVPDGFEFGDPAPWIVRSWGMILGVLLFVAFVVNHFVHNKNFKFKKINIEE